MSEFKLADFKRAKFSHREQEVKVPGLTRFFEGDPVWIVRGLTGEELAKVDEAAEQAKSLLAIAEGLVGGDAKAQATAIGELVGHSSETPAELVKRLTMLTTASIAPSVDRQTAVRLAENFPIEFKILVVTIMRLTGLGKDPGKLPGSGATPKSEPPQHSATPGEDSSSKSDQTSSQADT